MKRVLSILMLCSLLLLITVGTTQAYDENYVRIEYGNEIEKTFDGMWTTDDEWLDGNVTWIDENAFFVSTWIMLVDVNTNFLIEILDDNTTDAEDYWQICATGSMDGGSTPQTGDFKIELVGHTDLVCYEGDGTGWTEVTPDEGELNFTNSLNASPASSTPHWIAEFVNMKNTGVILMPATWVVRVAVYDESNSEAGVRAWPPPSDPDVPDGWGLNNYVSGAIPEGLSFGVVVLLSSVAVIVATLRFRKRSRIDKSS